MNERERARAHQIATRILIELNQRKGYGELWDEIAPETRDEIEAEIADLIYEEYR